MKILYKTDLKYVLLLIFMVGFLQLFSQHNARFSKIKTIDSRKGNTLFDVYQDSEGFIWLGSSNGLVKFDGINYTKYYPDDRDSTSINFSQSNYITEGKNGYIWVGSSGGGLNRLDKKTNTFKHYINTDSCSNCMTSNYSRGITVDLEGNIWIGTVKGLNKFNPTTEHFLNFYHNEDDSTSLAVNSIERVFADSKGNVWVGFRAKGINRLNTSNNNIHKFPDAKYPEFKLNDTRVFDFFEDESGKIWISTFEGLLCYNYELDEFTLYQHDPLNDSSLLRRFNTGISQDQDGFIWASSFDAGVNCLDPKTGIVTRYLYNEDDPGSFAHHYIRNSLIDHSNQLWLAHPNGMLSKLNLSAKKFNLAIPEYEGSTLQADEFHLDKNNDLWLGNSKGLFKYNYKSKKLESTQIKERIYSIGQFSDDRLWIGTRNGDYLISIKSKKILKNTIFKIPLNKNNKKPTVFDFLKDSKGSYWMATSNGIIRFNSDYNFKQIYNRNSADSIKIKSSFTGSLLEDYKGNIWVSSRSGAYKLNLITENVTSYAYDVSNPYSISHAFVSYLFEDSNHNIWIGTDDGLNLYDPTIEGFKHFNISDGFLSGSISSIEEDLRGNLWIGSDIGLIRFNHQTKSVKNYIPEDGVGQKDFHRMATKNTDGDELYFLGTEGINMFNPLDIKEDKLTPGIALTSFELFNQKIDPNQDHRILKQDINSLDRIELNYNDYLFRISYAGLHYAFPGKNHFMVFMEGLDDDWRYVGTETNATFTNLDPGNYTLKIKAANKDGIWSTKIKEIQIYVSPPWWETLLFRIIMVLTIISTIVAVFYWRTLSLRKKKEKLEDLVKVRTEEVEIQKEEILSQNEELEATLEQLENMNQNLSKKTDELEEFNSSMLDREMRIIDLKKEVNKEAKQNNKELPYPEVGDE